MSWVPVLVVGLAGLIVIPMLAASTPSALILILICVLVYMGAARLLRRRAS